jgi:hypothetical protein
MILWLRLKKKRKHEVKKRTFSTSTGKSLNLDEICELLFEIRRQANQIVIDELKIKDQKIVAKMFGLSDAVVTELKSGIPITLIMMAIRILTEFDKKKKKR